MHAVNFDTHVYYYLSVCMGGGMLNAGHSMSGDAFSDDDVIRQCIMHADEGNYNWK